MGAGCASWKLFFSVHNVVPLPIRVAASTTGSTLVLCKPVARPISNSHSLSLSHGSLICHRQSPAHSGRLRAFVDFHAFYPVDVRTAAAEAMLNANDSSLLPPEFHFLGPTECVFSSISQVVDQQTTHYLLHGLTADFTKHTACNARSVSTNVYRVEKRNNLVCFLSETIRGKRLCSPCQATRKQVRISSSKAPGKIFSSGSVRGLRGVSKEDFSLWSFAHHLLWRHASRCQKRAIMSVKSPSRMA